MAQGKPIPTRFDEATLALLDTLQGRTGLSKSDLIRRALAHTLRHIKTTGDTSMLYENPDLSVIAEDHATTTTAPTSHGTTYPSAPAGTKDIPSKMATAQRQQRARELREAMKKQSVKNKKLLVQQSEAATLRLLDQPDTTGEDQPASSAKKKQGA
jgi:nucleosome binding factor SPN SPT16 subunit